MDLNTPYVKTLEEGVVEDYLAMMCAPTYCNEVARQRTPFNDYVNVPSPSGACRKGRRGGGEIILAHPWPSMSLIINISRIILYYAVLMPTVILTNYISVQQAARTQQTTYKWVPPKTAPKTHHLLRRKATFAWTSALPRAPFSSVRRHNLRPSSSRTPHASALLRRRGQSEQSCDPCYMDRATRLTARTLPSRVQPTPTCRPRTMTDLAMDLNPHHWVRASTTRATRSWVACRISAGKEDTLRPRPVASTPRETQTDTRPSRVKMTHVLHLRTIMRRPPWRVACSYEADLQVLSVNLRKSRAKQCDLSWIEQWGSMNSCLKVANSK